MCGNEHLNQMIDFLSKYFQHRSISLWGTDRKCIFATELYRRYVSLETVVGKTLSEFNDYLKSHSDEFYNEITAKVLRNKSPVMAYYIYPNKGTHDYGIYSIVVTPILDEKKDVIAFISDGGLIENSLGFETLLNKTIDKKSSPKTEDPIHSTLKLTRRERIIIFLLICGKSHKEIALSLSKIYDKEILPNSVSSIISKQIYPKFNIYNNSSLLIFGLRLGILYNIPEELVRDAPMILYTFEDPRYETIANNIPWLHS